MTRATLREAPPPFAAEFSERGALREPIGRQGRVHIDRWLPFILLHRGPVQGDGLALRIASNGSAYALWEEKDDLEALSALAAIVPELAAHEGQLLAVTLVDGPLLPHVKGSDLLPPFEVAIGASGSADVERAAQMLERCLADLEIDGRRCETVRRDFEPFLPDRFSALFDAVPAVCRMTVTVPQIHRSAGGAVFPEIRHELAMRLGDALLRAACAFIDNGEREAPAHYRSLGRSAFLAAALKADKKLAAMASSFDFLLSISPVDTSRAAERFLAAGEEEEPRFHYRPLAIDPDHAKRDLYAIELDRLEDPLLEQLLSEKRREIDAQLTMLATRNTPAFRPASMVLYGTVTDDLLENARAILGLTGKGAPRGRPLKPESVAAEARALITRYRDRDPRFDAQVEVRDDVSGLLVSRGKLMVGSDSLVAENRLEALLAHEVGVHLLTYFNGSAQGLEIFASGLAGYEGVQEGLGVFAEWAVGGLTRARLRLLAGRVVAVHSMLQGAGFIDTYRLLTRDHGFTPRGAFGIAARVYRSGGLAKDAIYLKGFKTVVDLVAGGQDMTPFWLGKIARRHVPVIEQLLLRSLVRPPALMPFFLEDDGAKRRIARLREEGGITHIINGQD